MENVTKRHRERSQNWDSSDKILLQQLIEEKIKIIEDKRVDTNTSKAKREAWKEILSSFNQCSNTKRDVCQIQNQWRNTKMLAKKRSSTYKKERGATGGGAAPKSPDPDGALALLSELSTLKTFKSRIKSSIFLFKKSLFLEIILPKQQSEIDTDFPETSE